MYQFDFSVLLRDDLATRLVSGFWVTLQLAGYALVASLAIGLIVGTLRWANWRLLRLPLWLYIEFARNTPALVQLLFWYFSFTFIFPPWVVFAVRDLGFEFVACVLALSLYHGAFMSEVVRAGLTAISKGQYDASRALGLGFWQMMGSVIWPQAIRVALPPLVNETVSLVKNTPLGMAIGVLELTYQAKYIDSLYFRGVEALMVVTVVYLVLCLMLNEVGQYLSRRLSRHTGGHRELASSLD